MSAAHLEESALLRLVAGDLPPAERVSAESHLWACARCRDSFRATERLDDKLRRAGPSLADFAEPSRTLPEGDPFARRPAAGDRRAMDFGLDARTLAQHAAKAVPEARDLQRQLLSALSKDEQRQAALSSLDLDVLRDRRALAYVLDTILDDVEGDPSLRSHQARAVLERLDAVEGGPASNPELRTAAEYTMPLADLRGRVLLLSGAAALWSGDLEAARIHLRGAWEKLAAGRGSEVLFARVETFEALRRIAAGRYREAAALANRASAVFSISAHEVDAARATLVAGLAEWAVGRLRDAATALRKSALGFGRSGGWSGFVTAACGAALCLLADGRIEDSRRAFRDLRRRRARQAPLQDRLFVRETERIALLSPSAVSKGKKAAADFSAADAVLLPGASVRAEKIVSAARESDEKLEIALADLHGHPARAFALLYACQKGNALVAQDPLRALELARRLFEEAGTPTVIRGDVLLATSVSREIVQAEAKILESASQVQLGYALESRVAAVQARGFFRDSGDVRFRLALADYYEGQAAGFARDYVAGERLLKKAMKVFAEFGQDHLVGRAEAALGTLLGQHGDEKQALRYFDKAVDSLDPLQDGRHLATALNNRGQTLLRMKRFNETRIAYTRALSLARKLDARATIQNIRNGLAELEFQRGRYDRALRAFSDLANVARAADWKMEQLFAELYVAECLGRLGREQEMAETIVVVRAERKANPFAPSPAMEELFDCLDRGMLDADMIAHVRAYLEDEAKGISRPYVRLKIVGGEVEPCLLSPAPADKAVRRQSDVRRESAKEAPLADRMFARETERISLLLGRASVKGSHRPPPPSVSNNLSLRGASILAEGLVAAARKSDEALDEALRTLSGNPSRGFALLYACQKGNVLVAQDPLRALELARTVFEEAKPLMDANTEDRLTTPAPHETVQAEAKLLESQAQNMLAYSMEARLAANEARELFRAGGDVGFGMALADYYEGSAASFSNDYVAGERLLKKALKVFAAVGQDNLMGRAEAALATLYFKRGDEARALPYFDHAIELFDPVEDVRFLTASLINRSTALSLLGRLDEARASYARALHLARKLRSEAHIAAIRSGLAQIDMHRGEYVRALRAFQELSHDEKAAGWHQQAFFSDLFAAECFGRLGREDEMAEVIVALRRERRTNPFTPSPAMEELFACLDRGTLDADVLAHVRCLLEDEEKGVGRSYQRLDFAG
ncbi:MAG: hypothetical protein ACM3JH_01075 [Acidithiobacillales bacterium]